MRILSNEQYQAVKEYFDSVILWSTTIRPFTFVMGLCAFLAQFTFPYDFPYEVGYWPSYVGLAFFGGWIVAYVVHKKARRTRARLGTMTLWYRRCKKHRELIWWAEGRVRNEAQYDVLVPLDELWVIRDGTKARRGEEIDIDRGTVRVTRVLPEMQKVLLLIEGPTSGYRAHGAICACDIHHLETWVYKNHQEKICREEKEERRVKRDRERADRAPVVRLAVAKLEQQYNL